MTSEILWSLVNLELEMTSLIVDLALILHGSLVLMKRRDICRRICRLWLRIRSHKRYKILKGKLQAETRRLYRLVPLVGQDRQFKKL